MQSALIEGLVTAGIMTLLGLAIFVIPENTLTNKQAVGISLVNGVGIGTVIGAYRYHEPLGVLVYAVVFVATLGWLFFAALTSDRELIA